MNLLPWRKSRRDLERRMLLLIAFLVLSLSLAMVYLRFCYLQASIDQISAENDKISQASHSLMIKQKELPELEALKAQLTAKLKCLKDLDRSKKDPRFILEALTNRLSKTILLDEIRRRNNNIVLKGEASGTKSLTQFMQQLKKEPWVHKQVLGGFQLNQGIEKKTFLLKIHFVSAVKEASQ